LITDHSQRLTTGHREQAVNRALERVNRVSLEDKLAIALHDFAAVTAEDFVPFDYCDGPNDVHGHQGATAFPSTLALAASFDRDVGLGQGVAAHQNSGGTFPFSQASSLSMMKVARTGELDIDVAVIGGSLGVDIGDPAGGLPGRNASSVTTR
jgi:hypothetical protein